ncbi:MAG: hypothetical protein V2I37_00915 [Marinilabiliaceae bacterium]|jgi:hypothetical protein|nr:hypothetical protein [Marinilabiliaceae bacterium]
MKSTLYWILAIVITLSAAYYQRKTGPTYPKQIDIDVNGTEYSLRMLRSIEIGSGEEIKLAVKDTSVSARLYYKRLNTSDNYQALDFVYRSKAIDSWLMNRVFKITEEEGFFTEIPEQPAAGKIQYYFELTDKNGKNTYFENEPIVIRFKGAVPSKYLTPHILLMFIAMLLSTLAGLMAIGKHNSFRKYGNITLIFLLLGGMILGPVVQYHAFGAAWTGVPLGWDLTDNKTLIAVLFWIWAVLANRKRSRPGLTILAAFILLLVYSIPHSMYGSELDYSSGEVVQGIILNFLY